MSKNTQARGTAYIEFHSIEEASYDEDTRTLRIDVPLVCCEDLHEKINNLCHDLDLTKSQTVELSEKILDMQVTNYLIHHLVR
jgi:hypothetical protein